MSKTNPKACPFCFGEPYFYRTGNGLIRHVMYSHMYDSRHQLVFPPTQIARFVRQDITAGTRFLEISGWDEVEDFLRDYLSGFNNPSKRNSRFWQYVNES